MNLRFSLLRFVSMCAACVVVSSCLEDIDLNTGESILNVYCVLGSGPEQELELSYITTIDGATKTVEGDAVIKLYDEGVLCGEFSRVSETKWSLNYTPQGKHSYRLEVHVSGEKELVAETRYPPIAEFKKVYVHYTNSHSFPNPGFELNSDEDQILWSYVQGTKELAAYMVTDHPGVDRRGETIYPFDYTSDLWKLGFYDCNASIFSWMFDDKPAFLHEKVVRIVHPSGFCRSFDDNMAEVWYSYNRETVLGRTSMFGITCVTYNQSLGSPADIVICSVSAEYDRYLADYYYGNYDPDDFTSLVYMSNHYSNVKNGTGIFGASHTYRTKLEHTYFIF